MTVGGSAVVVVAIHHRPYTPKISHYITPKMDYDALIAHFGNQVTAAHKLGVTQPTLSNWKARGRIPKLQQLRIQHITRGKLKASEDILKVSR